MVKFISRPDFWSQTKQMLFLRYGVDSPDPDSKPKALLSLSVISGMMQVKLNRLVYLENKYFRSGIKERLSTIIPRFHV